VDLLTSVTRVVLPVAVGMVMFCLGLGLAAGDFAALVRRPRFLTVGAVCQVVVLPVLAWGLCDALHLSQIHAAGVLLIAACPASVSANLLARLARGNVAGAVSLAAVTAPVSALTIPIALAMSGYRPNGADAAELAGNGLLWRTAFSVAALVAVPVALGMLARALAPGRRDRIEQVALRLAVVAFVIGFALAVASVWTRIPASFRQVGVATLCLNVLGAACVVVITAAAGLPAGERVVVTLASSTRQFALAAFVALTLCRDADLLLPAIAYCLLMWATALGSVAVARLRPSPAAAAPIPDPARARSYAEGPIPLTPAIRIASPVPEASRAALDAAARATCPAWRTHPRSSSSSMTTRRSGSRFAAFCCRFTFPFGCSAPRRNSWPRPRSTEPSVDA
jgi:BASS family bile acid:Na+ symporter